MKNSELVLIYPDEKMVIEAVNLAVSPLNMVIGLAEFVVRNATCHSVIVISLGRSYRDVRG